MNYIFSMDHVIINVNNIHYEFGNLRAFSRIKCIMSAKNMNTFRYFGKLKMRNLKYDTSACDSLET